MAILACWWRQAAIKLLYSRLYSYIEQHNMLSEHQYGFRSGLSTSLATYEICSIGYDIITILPK